MKSFYQFYESISAQWTRVYTVYRRVKGPGYNNILIEKVYADLAQANIAANNLKNGEVNHYSYIQGPLPHNGKEVYNIMAVDKYSETDIYNEVYVDKNEADIVKKSLIKALDKYGWIFLVEQTVFVTNTSVKPKSPYANLKHPLISELTHYLSIQNLNQEVYQTMRDKSQKSINLLNHLRTLIKKIELT